ncbi:pectin acetylesterase 5-like isoform X3 [Triticum dicoccoides]|uniref:pectin acetylesterase 5-like isoform X3 n=1 Tax=Triticum dicoccoides TaxID=85692 RepID=UPI00188E2436|nr:pectin acetylesterase 5-like isoform X3 [Triticum dicoccoides]XP_044352468.1 pectin acetylesterase 5-like isoform X3 [Triticum aestivum]
MAPSNLPAALLLLLLLASSGPLRPTLSGAAPLEPVEVSLVAGAQEKGAVCLDGTPPGYHLQRGSGDGSGSWLVHLEGGGWCSTLKDCSGRRMSVLGSSKFMKPLQFAGHGIFDSDEIYNPDFYNWNKVYVRYCDGASFAGDAEGQAQFTSEGYASMKQLLANSWKKDSPMLHRSYFTYQSSQNTKNHFDKNILRDKGCSAGGLATILHCDDFSARFPQQVSVKCFADAGFFLDVRKDISGERSFWSFYNRVVQLQTSVAQGLPCQQGPNRELIKSIRTPMFILNSAYDSWQIQNVLLPTSSSPEKTWLSCKDNIRNCNSTQIKVLDEIRNTMINDLKVINDKADWGMFIDSCFTHCQTLFRVSWSSPTSPRLGNKNIAKVVGDWYFGRSQGVKEIDCEYPCNPTCNSLPPP